jgi:nitrate/nitrite transport system permease protein
MSATTAYSKTFEIPRLERWLAYLSGDGINRLAGGATRSLIVPLVGIGVFLLIWAATAARIETSLGQLPGPVQVWEQGASLLDEHKEERTREAAFYERQEKRVEKAVAAGKPQEKIDKIRSRTYTGAPTFIDQIWTSLITVATGFLIASLIAVPIGILCGMSATLYAAMNPFIQVFKPVSPLAWLPLVTIIVSAVYVTDDPWLAKSFLNSAITVTLCCLWPTIINTTVGVSTVDKDLMNVSRVLRLSWVKQTIKIILPSAMPMIFTGLRLSLGIGWMVLIAAEMLSQNPGLGKFVWDEFQNGSSNSLARIMVAVFVIGFIGFLLDRVMLMLQRHFSWDKSAVLR